MSENKSIYMRKYRAENRDKILSSKRSWEERNIEKRRELNRASYAKNRKKRLEAIKRYSESHSEQIKKWKNENAAAIAESNRAWRKANPDKCRLLESKRRSKIKAGTATQAEIQDIRNQQGEDCFYCWGPIGNNGRGHIEHKTPLIRDGLHEASNIVISCPACNHRKSRQTDSEFTEKSVSHKTIAKKFSILMQRNPDSADIIRELLPIWELVSELKEKLAKEVK